MSQPPEVLQTGLGDLGVAKVQPLELGQILEVLQTRVRDFGAAEIKSSESRQTPEAIQIGTGDPETQIFRVRRNP